MFDTLDLFSTTKDLPTMAPGSDADGLLQAFNGVIASSAATGVTLAPAAAALLHIGDQLTRQDAETGGGKKSGKKKGKTKTINKSNLPDKTIRGFYFNVALLFRLTVEQRRRKGRLRSIRTTAYQEIVGLTGISGVNFEDTMGVKYTYNSENDRVLRSDFRRVKGLIEVIKPDGTRVYLFGR